MGAWLSFLFASPNKVVHVNNRKLLIKRQLGEGGFSYVYEVKDAKDHRVYALKKMLCQTDELLNTGHHEISVLQKFNHPNILKLVDHTTVPSQKVPGAQEILILIPFIKNGTLQDALEIHRAEHGGNNCTTSPFSEKEALTLFKGMCEGVRQFHTEDPPLALRDIKPGNVLLSTKLVPVLMDFGSVTEARVTVADRRQALALQETAELMCTPQFRAPELFNIPSECVVDERTDIWSLGCTLYAIIYGIGPFETCTSVALAVQNPVPFPPTLFSPQLTALVKSMLAVDYRERPFISDVINSADNILKTIETAITM
jgi:serine/threonine kinase 16